MSLELGKVRTKVIAIISTVSGLIVVIVSSYLVQQARRMKNHPVLHTLPSLLEQVNPFFGETYDATDVDVTEIFRILIGCGVTGLAGGFIQFFASLFLLVASIRERLNPWMLYLWMLIEITIMIALLASLICITTNEIEIPNMLPVFLTVSAIDIFIVILSVTVEVTCIILDLESNNSQVSQAKKLGLNNTNNDLSQKHNNNSQFIFREVSV